MKEMFPKEVAITTRGSILLARHFVCDGYALNRQVGVVSHFHSDHTFLLPIALRYCKFVLMTHATRELLLFTRSENLPLYLDKLKGMPLTESKKFDGERITLLPAKHVLGAAQVLVETEEGERLLYSGDFLVPGTLPPEADILVTEATYGSPNTARKYDRDLAMRSLAQLVKRSLTSGPVSIVAYQGKIQEVMNKVFEQGINVPFLVSSKVFDICQVYRKYGIEVGDCIMLDTTESKEIEKDPHIVFLTRKREMQHAPTQILVSGRCLVPFRQLNSKCYVVGISTHADFNGLLWYIKKSKAKFVIVDGTRHSNAAPFSYLIEKNLRVKCMVDPR
jgi:putative mRNA 3-end processing factor